MLRAASRVLPAKATLIPRAFGIITITDPTWNMDTGASSHLNSLTSNLNTVYNKRLYPSVCVGDGKTIPVTNTGHSILSTLNRPLYLHNVLVTPNIIKNLISVRQFTRDNNCTVEFDAFGFSVKDYFTRHILLRCDSSGDLYRVTQPSPIPHALLSVSPTTWHHASGIPVKKCFIVHSDIWTSPIVSSGEWHSNAVLVSSQQNGKSERMIRTINNVISTLLFQAHLPPSFWVEALHMAAYLLNILPSYAIQNDIPYAMYDEYNALIKNGTWILVLKPPNVNVVLSMWLFRHKYHVDGSLSRYKARLVANGCNQQHGVDYSDTFSLVVKTSSIRIVLSLALTRNWPMLQLDVKNAFFNGDPFKTVYMHQPPGFVDSRFPHHVCRLQRSLYGLKQAPRAWFQRFAGYALRVVFTSSRCDSSLFIYQHGTEVAYLLIYVDDIVLTASSTALLQRIISFLHKEFDMTDLGALIYFLGISVTRDARGMFLSQKKYDIELLEGAHMSNCNATRSLVDTESKLGSNGDPISDSTFYRSLAGGLQYLTFTRPDISYVMQQICLHMHDPREPHLAALKRVLRYVCGTLDFALQLYASPTSSLVVYADADCAGCPTTRRTTLGYCVFFGDNLLSWLSKRQHTISRSSAEAEYRGVANVVVETAWLRNLLRELHTPLLSATLVYCDNVSTIYMTANPVQHNRTKHIEIDIHFVRDMVAQGQVRVLHVPSRYQYADIFTKGLSSALFEESRTSLSVRSSPAQTTGEC
ncbi:ribonuclease H-like domain-containing protein [Tanacetum coccineum]